MTISKKLAALSLAVSLSLFSVTPAVMAAKAVPKDVNYLVPPHRKPVYPAARRHVAGSGERCRSGSAVR